MSAARRSTLIPAALALLAMSSSAALAQQSASFKLTEAILNAGGHPSQGTVLASASFRITLDSVGEPIAARTPMAGANFQVEGGFTPGHAPPGEVLNLRALMPTVMAWDPVASASRYNVYRDNIGSFMTHGTCYQSGHTGTITMMPGDPSPGQGWYFLVTAENSLNEEGPKGYNSQGVRYPGSPACP